MGHTRLGPISKSADWKDIIAKLIDSSVHHNLDYDFTSISFKLLLSKIRKVLHDLKANKLFQYTTYLLFRTILSFRESDWQTKLKEIEIDVDKKNNIHDLLDQINICIEQQSFYSDSNEAISEILQRSVNESILGCLPSENLLLFDEKYTLFDKGQALSTKDNLASISRHFFGNFLYHLTNFYFSKIIADNYSHIGNINEIADITSFNDFLKQNSFETASIVTDFSSTWLLKNYYHGEINQQTIGSYVSVALKKIIDEVGIQEAEI